jgi:hypothetical protein
MRLKKARNEALNTLYTAAKITLLGKKLQNVFFKHFRVLFNIAFVRPRNINTQHIYF